MIGAAGRLASEAGGGFGAGASIAPSALAHPVSSTNLKRVLLRRGVLEPTGEVRSPGPTGGRPAQLFRFRSRRLEITDPFAVLRPPR